MIPLPRTTQDRAALRDRLVFAAMERAQRTGGSAVQARRKGEAAFRSLLCVNSQHGNCRSQLDTCLCDCHDPAVPARLPAPAPTTFSDGSTR